nr:glomulin isoform X2 [Ciona intestinalis]|eukprot:XP_026693736.1 glomulin isoform X2 [Ciona intestinalis]
MKSNNTLKNKCYDMSMTFSSLTYYCDSLNLPKYENYDPTEKCEQPLEESKILRYVEKCIDISNSMLSVLIQSLTEVEKSDENLMESIVAEPLSFYCCMLERLSQLNVEEQNMCNSCKPNCIKSTFAASSLDTVNKATVCSKIIKYIHEVRRPWCLLCDKMWEKFVMLETKLNDEDKTLLARGCYLYLVYVKHQDIDSCTQVVNPLFNFTCCFHSVLTLLKSSNETTIYKGLEMFCCIINKLDPFALHWSKLTYNLINLVNSTSIKQPVMEIFLTAVSIAVHNSNTILRQKAIQLVPKFLDKFVWIDRSHLLERLLSVTEHYGVKGYLCQYFKNKLNDILQDDPPPGAEVFISESRFSAILEQVLVLSNGSDSDFLQEHDLVMSGLNLLRFLLLRDVKNLTGVWSCVKRYEVSYIKPIRTGLNLSAMHYRDELQNRTKPTSLSPDFYVNGLDFPALPAQKRKEVVDAAILSFDIMQGVCSRVQQLIDKNP